MRLLLIAFFSVLLGCAGTPATKPNPSPSPTPTLVPTTILSDPPRARIEVDNDYVGDAPVQVNLGRYSYYGSPGITIRATPQGSGYVQTKFLSPFDPLPSRIIFQMNLQPVQ